jgi:rubrerythrin
MVWWMRRARRLREDSVKRFEEKRREVEAKVPKDDTKVPSLQRAMGLEPEPSTFVCSDCGADVPAEARKCPVCGEKFE